MQRLSEELADKNSPAKNSRRIISARMIQNDTPPHASKQFQIGGRESWISSCHGFRFVLQNDPATTLMPPTPTPLCSAAPLLLPIPNCLLRYTPRSVNVLALPLPHVQPPAADRIRRYVYHSVSLYILSTKLLQRLIPEVTPWKSGHVLSLFSLSLYSSFHRFPILFFRPLSPDCH